MSVGVARAVATAERPSPFDQLVRALRDKLAAGIEPGDDELDALALYRHPSAERELAQLYYWRALLREEREEREDAAARAALRAADGDDDDSYDLG